MRTLRRFRVLMSLQEMARAHRRTWYGRSHSRKRRTIAIGFRDPNLEHLSESRELNFLLVPFLNKKLPQQMRINAAELIRQLLQKSAEATGYDVKLDNLEIHSTQVNGDSLVVDFDGDLSVH